MSESRRSGLAEAVQRMRAGVENKKVQLAAGEVEHLKTVAEFLTALDGLLRGKPDGKALRYWIDSSASVLGKKLASEVLASAPGKGVKEAMTDLIDFEEELADSNKDLQKTAEAAGVTVEQLLSDDESEDVLAFKNLRNDTATQAAELHTALQAYALELVGTLRVNNSDKLQMTTEELAAWQAKFAAVEALPQDYESYQARLVQEFVASKRLRAEGGWGDIARALRERRGAIGEKVWGDYAHHLTEVLKQELPGEDNEEKRRHLLAGLLRHDDENLIVVSGSSGRELVILKGEVLQNLPRSIVVDLAKHNIRAHLLSALRLHNLKENLNAQENVNRQAYQGGLGLIAALGKPETWEQYVEGGLYVSKLNLLQVIEMSAQEVGLANEVDAVVRFLYEGLNSKIQRTSLTRSADDYRLLSPVWRDTDSRGYQNTNPAIPLSVSADGVFYSPIGAPAESRVAMSDAAKEAAAFAQGLSDTLNRDKLQEEHSVMTPSDAETRNNRRIKAAEEQALAATRESKRQAEMIRELQAQLAEVRKNLQGRIDLLEDGIEAAKKRADMSEATLTEERAGRVADEERSRKNLAEAKKASERELKDAQRVATEKLNAILGQLQAAASNPGLLGGTLKEVVGEILAANPVEEAEAKKKK